MISPDLIVRPEVVGLMYNASNAEITFKIRNAIPRKALESGGAVGLSFSITSTSITPLRKPSVPGMTAKVSQSLKSTPALPKAICGSNSTFSAFYYHEIQLEPPILSALEFRLSGPGNL